MEKAPDLWATVVLGIKEGEARDKKGSEAGKATGSWRSDHQSKARNRSTGPTVRDAAGGNKGRQITGYKQERQLAFLAREVWVAIWG